MTTVDVPSLIGSLRSEVFRANHILNPATLGMVKRLYGVCTADPAHLDALRALSAEYGKHEFLLNVDAQGMPAPARADLIVDLDRASAHHPGLRSWFEEGQVDDQPVLLVARWLCHLAGLRHRTVQLFLDHPTVDGYTLIQVRGLNKAEAPGCFDVPCAGHVTGLETVAGTLLKELHEELGLDLGDVSAPEMLGRYEYCGEPNDPALYNVEYRAVYRSRLQPGALSRIRFVDGEVAAVALFAASEVRRLIEAAPERVASGLALSWAVYLERERRP
jgi:isopentenyldiphosphate isomerase